jgi:PAS domain S-box-containing protein
MKSKGKTRTPVSGRSSVGPNQMAQAQPPSANNNGNVFQDQAEFLCRFLPDYQLTYANIACYRYFGIGPDDLFGKSFMNLIPTENQSIVHDQLSALSTNNPFTIYEQHIVKPNGEILWQEWTVRAIFSDTGKLIEYQATGRDITKRKLAEEDLRKTKKQYEAVIEDQMDLVCRYLPDGTLTFVNQAYCNYHGKGPHELIGTNFLPTIRPQDREDVIEFVKTADPEHPVSIQIQQRITKNNSETMWVEWRRRALFDDHGTLHEIQSVGRDITDFKRTEAALKSSEKALREKNIELERKNTALTEVLEQIEQQKQQIKDEVITNVEDLLIPVLEQLMSKGSKIDETYLTLIRRSLEDLTSSFGRKITHKNLKLTPREIHICNMVKRGLASKEIAKLLNISLNTVGRHRHSIRKKAGITRKNMNLSIFLKDL